MRNDYIGNSTVEMINTTAHSNGKYKLKASTLRTALLIVAFAYAPLSSYVSGVFNHIPIIRSYSDYVVPALIIILVLLNIREIVKRINYKDFIAGLILSFMTR